MSVLNKERFFNIPALIVGWHGDTGARVEVMIDLPELGIAKGNQFNAMLREDPKKIEKYQITFKTHRDKNALRVGGIVLMRKALMEEDGSLSGQTADILLESPKYGHAYMLPGAAVSIVAPPPGTMMVDEAYIACMSDAIVVRKSLAGALAEVHDKLEFIRSFGLAGLILTGEDDDGNVSEYLIFMKPDAELDTMEANLREAISRDIEKKIVKAKKPWFLVPAFKSAVDIDPARRSKVSAMRSNFDYGAGDDLNWTPCNCIMKSPGDAWYVNDVTPLEDKVQPELLLDLLESE